MARARKAAPVVLDPLDAMLTRLQLTGIRDQLDTLLDEAGRANLSARETLALLCEREIARKDHRRIEMALLARHETVVWVDGVILASRPGGFVARLLERQFDLPALVRCLAIARFPAQ